MKKNQNFTEGAILPLLLKFAFPVLLALFLQAMYGAVDLLVVGQFSTAEAVSAVSTGSQIMHSITTIITGLAMGLTVLVAQRIGEKRPEEAGSIIGSGICLFGAGALLVTVAMVAGSAAAARIMQAPPEAFDQTVAYIRICSAGTVFIVAYNILGSIFRGIGDSKIPLLAVAIACVFNVAGDMTFVAGLHMGAAGAALATVMAQAVSVMLSLLIIRKRRLPFILRKSDLRFNKKHVTKILSLGTPIALQDLLVSISFLILIAIVNSMGVVASAGVGVAEKLCAFVMLVPSAFMQSMSAFVAQNVGAMKPERAKKALAYGIGTSVLAGFLLFYISFFHGDLMSAIFTKEAAVIAASADYLKAYAIDCMLTAFLFCFVGYFNGRGETLFVMLQGIAGAFCVRIPVAWFMSRIPGVTLFMLGLATPCSTVVQILFCIAFFFMKERKNMSLQKEQLKKSHGRNDRIDRKQKQNT